MEARVDYCSYFYSQWPSASKPFYCVAKAYLSFAYYARLLLQRFYKETLGFSALRELFSNI